MRTKLLAAMATVMAIVGIGVMPSLAAAESLVEPSGQTVEPRIREECPGGYVCAWTGPTFGGERRQWAGSEIGCHSHAFTGFESVYNHTGNKTVYALNWFPPPYETLTLGPGGYQGNRGAPWGGELCIQ
jgi:Peptidase inhibitor family I36